MMHNRIICRLAESAQPIRGLIHPAEGNTVNASRLRGHAVEAAAKSIVLRIGMGRKRRQYVLAVVCGHRRVNLNAVAECYAGTDVHFADDTTAFRLTGCVSGAVMPVSFNNELLVIGDHELLDQELLWFNSGRLDHSIALPPVKWQKLANPRMENIAEG